MIQEIFLIGVIIYFVKEQFNYNKIKKLTYFFLPSFFFIQFIFSFQFTFFNVLILLFLVVVSLLIGYFQASHVSIKTQYKPVLYFLNDDKKEQSIYKKNILLKGGKEYLIGWLIIFGIQLFVQYIYTKQALDLESFSRGLYEEIIADLLSVYRFESLEHAESTWYVWALYGISNLAYTLFLCKKFPSVKNKLFHTDGELVD